jgi:hypothetical protein
VLALCCTLEGQVFQTTCNSYNSFIRTRNIIICYFPLTELPIHPKRSSHSGQGETAATLYKPLQSPPIRSRTTPAGVGRPENTFPLPIHHPSSDPAHPGRLVFPLGWEESQRASLCFGPYLNPGEFPGSQGEVHIPIVG